MKKKIVFVSTNAHSPWGGSEALWSEAAHHLMQEGHPVSASVLAWPRRAAKISSLVREGIVLNERWSGSECVRPQILRKVLRGLVQAAAKVAFSHWLAKQDAALVCICSGSPADDPSLTDLCVASGRPYALLIQANAEHIWPLDGPARRMIEVVEGAHKVYFVSQRNRTLLEAQLGIELMNAEVVRNPYLVSRGAAPAWPGNTKPWRLACVGRLDPGAKGQDLLLDVIASERWRSRDVEVSLVGSGGMEEGLRRMVKRLGLMARVHFRGQVDDIEAVWADHHALVLFSRYEGLPLALVEAMLCGRPAIVTDVAGNTEVVEDGVNGFVAQAPTFSQVDQAMERAWTRREEWREMGLAAARAIRELIPTDPASEFAKKLVGLVGQ